MGNNIKVQWSEVTNVGNFGVELELINVDKPRLIEALKLKGIDCVDEGYTHRVTTHWKLVSDSSLRGNNAYELVSPILNGQGGLRKLQSVCKALDFLDVSVNKSCGCHIHHQAPSNISEQQKTNLMKFYARLERTIDAFMPVSRKRNNSSFCKSMIEAYNLTSYSDLSCLGRYYKLNFVPLGTYGTLEFRQHAGTTDFEKLYHWIIFTANFLHLCKDKTSRSAMNFIERAWTKKHLKLSNRTWGFFKTRMKKLDDLDREAQGGQVRVRTR